LRKTLVKSLLWLRQWEKVDHLPDDFQSSLNALSICQDKVIQRRVNVMVLGRVGVGKSALLNALSARNDCPVNVLHGETRKLHTLMWKQFGDYQVCLQDSPGIDEVDGMSREQLALDSVQQADVLLFVIDGDLTDKEYSVLEKVAENHQPVFLLLNKIDRYSDQQCQELMASLQKKASGLMCLKEIISCVSEGREQQCVETDQKGHQREFRRHQPPEVQRLEEALKPFLTQAESLVWWNACHVMKSLEQKFLAHWEKIQQLRLSQQRQRHVLFRSVGVMVMAPLPGVGLCWAAWLDTLVLWKVARLYPMAVRWRCSLGLFFKLGFHSGLLASIMLLTVHVQSQFSGLEGWLLGLSCVVLQGVTAAYGGFAVVDAVVAWRGKGFLARAGGARNLLKRLRRRINSESPLWSLNVNV
jgi:GTPase